MKITNKEGAPEALYNAVKNDPYDKGDSDFTVTQLIDSARISALRTIHDQVLEEDVSDRRHALYGQVVHRILERSAALGATVSKRFYTALGGFKISGEIDYFKSGELEDWKYVGEYGFKDGVPLNYKIQLNCLRYLMHKNGIEVNKLFSVPIYRDQKEYNAIRPNWWERLEVAVRPLEEVEKYLLDRVKAHSEAIITLPECTTEERWVRNEQWAVMKEGRKSAVRLFSSEQDAKALARDLGSGHNIQRREGFSRCQKHCVMGRQGLCKQYEAIKAEGE
jgi:hypothetical protein